jgi:hypothetical protein
MAIMQVPVTKGKGIIEIDTDSLPEAVYAEALLQGLKTLVNRGQSKITVKELGDTETVKREAMLAAEKQKEKILSGDIKFSGKAKATKVSGAVNTEAMRIARNRVKDAIKASGKRISHYTAKDISAAAKSLIEADPSILADAEAAIAKRSEIPVATDLLAMLKEDPKLVAKAEAKKAEAAKDKPLSAKQAGLVKGRKQKPETVHTSH